MEYKKINCIAIMDELQFTEEIPISNEEWKSWVDGQEYEIKCQIEEAKEEGFWDDYSEDSSTSYFDEGSTINVSTPTQAVIARLMLDRGFQVCSLIEDIKATRIFCEAMAKELEGVEEHQDKYQKLQDILASDFDSEESPTDELEDQGIYFVGCPIEMLEELEKRIDLSQF